MIYVDDVNILGGSVHTIKKYTESLVDDSMEMVLVVITDKTKHMVFPRDQNARRSRNVKIDKNSFEMVEQYEHLGKPELIRILFRKKLRAD
jgi:hypothetical protein